MRWFESGANKGRRSKHRLQRGQCLRVERLESRRLLAATNILTYLGDLSGTGVNANETTLTPLNVNSSSFGKQMTVPLDGQVYAQPLYMTGVNITTGVSQGIHNVVFVATAHDSLYAIDADNGSVLWQTSFITNTAAGVVDVNPNVSVANTVVGTVPSADVNSTDITPEIGIIATPVIDPATNTLYLTAKTKDIINGNTSAPHFIYQLYAINIANGRLQTSMGGGVVTVGDTLFSGSNYTNTTPIAVAATSGLAVGQSGGIIQFNALREMDRSGLTLADGRVWLAFASHGDNGPYHGWILSYSAAGLQLNGVFNSTPGGTEGGTWQSGGKIEVDSNGALYFETGNGTFDSTLSAQGMPVNGDYGDSVVKLVVDPTTTAAHPNENGWGLTVADYFAPFNQANLNSNDTDLAASGLVLLPDSLGTAAHPHLLLARGKSGEVYLLDRDNLGKFSPTTDHVVQEFKDTSGYWSSPVYFDGWIYGTPAGGNLHQWFLNSAAISSVVASSPDTFGFPGATGSISANGTANGIVWELDKTTNQLRAYSAAQVSQELYTSGQNSARDALGAAVKFAVPTVDNGHVYVGTANSLVIYGLLNPPTTAPSQPTSLTAAALSNSHIQLSWTRTSTNEAGFYIERSTDGVHFTQVGLADAGASSFIDANNLAASTTYTYRIRAFNSIGTSAYSNTASATTLLGVVGQWADADVGTTNATGGASFANNTFTVLGAGSDILGTSDSFHYVYQPLSGDGTIIAQVLTQTNTNSSAKAGIMIRSSLAANAAYVDLVVTPGGTTLFESRATTGASAVTQASVSGTAPEWLMLTRRGNVFTALVSADGVSYTAIGSATISMASGVSAGLAVTSHNSGTLSTATFSNVLILPPQTYLSDLTAASVAGPLVLDKSDGGNTIKLGGTTYNKGLGVQANSDIVYNIGGQYTQFIADLGIDDDTAGSGAAYFQIYGDGTLLYDSGSLTGNGGVKHVVVNVAGVNSLELIADDGATGNTADHADWAGAELVNAVPAAPRHLQANVATGTQINLTWTDNSSNENAFEILRQDPGSPTFNVVGVVGANITSFNNAGLANGQTYSYEVLAVNSDGNSQPSNVATASIPSVPADPQNLTVTNVTTTTVTLTWTIPPTNDTAVNIYRRDTTTSAFPLLATLPANTTTFTDTRLTPGTEHEYSVQTLNLGGVSGPTNVETALLTVPPIGVTAINANGAVHMTWSAASGAASYNVYRGTAPGGEGATPYAAGLTGPSYTDSNVTNHTTYYYQITAMDEGGESAPSAEISLQVQPAQPVDLAAAYNRLGITADGVAYTGGFDGKYSALSANLLGSSLTAGGVTFSIGAPGVADVVSGGGQTIALLAGSYSTLNLLGAAVNGNQVNQQFVVHYTDGTSQTFTQGVSDWFTPQNYASETTAITMPYRNGTNGAKDNRTFRLYSYSFTLISGKTVSSITLPNDGNVNIVAMTLAGASSPIVIPTLTAPGNFTASAVVGAINLSWSAVSGATGYNVFRGTTSGGESNTPLNTAPLTGTTYQDTNVVTGGTYFYVVQAVSATAASPNSNEASANVQVAGASQAINLSSSFNRLGITADGVPFTGGFDGKYAALSASLLGSSLTVGGTTFTIAAAGANNVVAAGGQTIALPAGTFSTLNLLAAGVNGNQASQRFVVRYTDGTSQTFTQSISDWFTPQNYAGETTAITMAYRNGTNGAKDNRTFRLYSYSFSLTAGKTLSSITLPANGNVSIVAMTAGA